jgi:ribokinase
VENEMPGRIPKVVVVGGTYVDMAIRCDQIPSSGQSFIGSALSYTITGPGASEAVEVAMCDCQVHLISKVGGDPFGQMVRANLSEYNIDTTYLYTAEAKNTGAVVTFVNAEGENASVTYLGANGALLPQDIDVAEQVIRDSDVCLIHGRLPQAAIVAAIRCAKLHGVTIILNPARPLDRPGKGGGDVPLEYFSADILIPNLYEAADITEHSAANIHTAKLIGSDLVARGVGSAVITMGKRGCMIVDRAGADHIPAFEIELVDQTGTGDAFAGALAASCAVGDDIRRAVKFASAAGALACTKFGAIESLPAKAEIIELLQKQDIE